MSSNLNSASQKPKPKRQKRNKKKKILPWILLLTLSVVVVAGISAYFYSFKKIEKDSAWIYIPAGSTIDDVQDSLISSLGETDGERVYRLWSLQGGDAKTAHGAYKITQGDKAISVSRRLLSHNQTPVNVTWSDARTLSQMAEKITKGIECTPGEFLAAIEPTLAKYGYDNIDEYRAAFLPDTYEVYWDITPIELITKLVKHTQHAWNADRKAKANVLGLTPLQVTTLASIVEEETAKTDERGKVARLYLNRLNIGMKLQADPTVKYAVGDFTIKRIKGDMLKKDSPYNTYLYKGLPPGPIRIANLRTIDAVLDAPNHDYLYMCAKGDFSGYHNFAKDYATHQSNAKKYQTELNKRNIN